MTIPSDKAEIENLKKIAELNREAGDWQYSPVSRPLPTRPTESQDDILEHHGTKGMKWGVRNEDKGGGGKTAGAVATHNEKTKMYMEASRSIKPPTDRKVAEANLAENRQKFAKKFEHDGAPGKSEWGTEGTLKKVETKKSLTPAQKKALMYVGGAVVVGGGTYLAGKYLEKKYLQSIGIPSVGKIHDLAGQNVDTKQFKGLVGFSQAKTWIGRNYINDASYARPAFELPAGHTFYRLTTTRETDFSGATYALHSVDDFNRYVAGFRGEISSTGVDLKQVTWRAKEAIKVPDLTTVLSEMSEVLKSEGSSYDPKSTVKAYTKLSGGGWESGSGKMLISRLKSSGYGALVDEMDAGVIGETPLVFFGTDSVTPKKTAMFDMLAIDRAEALLKEINKPPGRKL